MSTSTLKTKDIKTSLCKKGFVEDNNNHKKLNFLLDGKKTRMRTQYSHGKNEVGEPLISMMARQIGLTKKQFIDLVSCSLSEEEYCLLVKEKC